MTRKVPLLALLITLALALFGRPVSARLVESAPEAPQTARIAPAGGILSNARLKLAAGSGEGIESPWTAIAAMPVGVRTVGGGAFVGAKKSLHVPGGYKADGTLHDRMQFYNPHTNVWNNESEVMPVGVGWADSAICVNPATNVIHVVNGVDGIFLYAAHQVYHPAAPAGSRWGVKAIPELANGDFYYSQSSGCAWLGGKMYLWGGYAVVGSNPAEITKATWEYDPATNNWSNTGRLMITGRLWGAYANSSTAAFAVGGTDDLSIFAPTDTNESFTPAGGWVVITGMAAGQGRIGNGLSILGDHLVQYGGATYAAGSFTLQAETLVCASNGNCAAWGPAQVPGGKQLGTPRWFGAWAGAEVDRMIGVYAGGYSAAGAVPIAEKLP